MSTIANLLLSSFVVGALAFVYWLGFRDGQAHSEMDHLFARIDRFLPPSDSQGGDDI